MSPVVLGTLLLLLAGCGDDAPAPPAPIDAEAIARAWLEAHPRTTIASLGGDHEAKVMPMVGEVTSPVFEKVFPDHRFFEFRVSMFSGRRNPKGYVAVSKKGMAEEFIAFRDFGIDKGAEAFFVRHARVDPGDSGNGVDVLTAYGLMSDRELEGIEIEEHEDGGFTVRCKGAVLRFDGSGRVTSFSAK